MVFNATFNNISGLFVEEPGVPRETHAPATSHGQTLSHYVVSSASRLSRTRAYNVSGDRY